MVTVYKCSKCLHTKEEPCEIKISGFNMPLMYHHICVIDGSNAAEFNQVD